MSKQTQAKQPFPWVALITVLGLVARLIWVWKVPTEPVTDFAWYFHRADEMARGLSFQIDGKPTAYWPVGYPFVLSVLFRFTGASILAGKLLSTALCTLLIPLTDACARRLTASRAAGIIAALIVAVHPTTIAFSSILASEPLFTALCLLSVLAFNAKLVTGGRAALGGLLVGLAAMVRPQAALLALLFPPLSAKRDTRVLMVVISVVFLALALVPWTIRNYQVFHRVVFVSTNGGDNLWIGNHSGASGRYETPPSSRPENASLDEISRDQASQREAVKDILADPGQIIRLAPAKLVRTFWDGTDAAYWAFQTQFDHDTAPGRGDDKGLYKATLLANVAAVRILLAAAGAATLLMLPVTLFVKGFRLPWESLTFVGTSALIAVVFFGNPRFAFPCIPFFAVLVGSLVPAVQAVFAKRPNRKPSKVEASQPRPAQSS